MAVSYTHLARADDEAGGADREAAAPAGESAGSGPEGGDETISGEQGAASAPQATAFPQFTPPKDAETTLADIRGRIDRLDAAFDDGEMTAAEHRVQTRALVDAERQVRDELLMAQMSEKARMQTYQSSVHSFLAANADYAPGSQKYHLLDAELRRRQNEASGAGRDPLDPALIVEAHASLRSLFGTQSAQAAQQAPPQKVQEPKARRELPPSIAGLPAADMQSVSEGHFAGLARLNGEDFEAAFAKLSDSQREQFLAQAN